MIDSIYNDGERFVPWLRGTNYLEHFHRYHFAKGLVRDKQVLDIACGEGFGSSILAETASKVIGVDIQEPIVAHARETYRDPKLQFEVGSVTAIPWETNSFDVVVSFETIEHIKEQAEMLAEVKRVLLPNGILILSSPERKFSADIAQYENPHHEKELYLDELAELVGSHFQNLLPLRQRIVLASEISSPKPLEGKEGFTSAMVGREDQVPDYGFNIVLASDGALPACEHSMFSSHTEFRSLVEEKKQVFSSITYRVGNGLLTPLRLLRKWMK